MGWPLTPKAFRGLDASESEGSKLRLNDVVLPHPGKEDSTACGLCAETVPVGQQHSQLTGHVLCTKEGDVCSAWANKTDDSSGT